MKYHVRRHRHAVVRLFCSAALLAPVASWAQDAPPPVAATNGKQIYSPQDFARFAPKSALDMVKQVPGFSIQEADERRGLGQATANILIDGKRISGKSINVETTLGRINAGDVTRIEIIDGATLDIPGLSGQVANIVTSVSGLSGNFRWSPQIRAKRTDPRLLDGELSVTGKSGALDYTLSLSNVSFRNGNAGDEFVLDGNGQQVDQRYEELYIDEDKPRIAGTLKYEDAAGSIANLNLSYERFYFTIFEDSQRSFPGKVDRRRDYRETEREWNYEVSGDYEFDLGAGRLKLIGLRRFEHSPFFSRLVFEYADGSADTGETFHRTADEGESILRSEYRWKGGAADWQVSAEGAFNTLDNRSRRAVLDLQGIFQPVPFDGGDSKVKEKRAELMLSYGRPLGETLSLQSAIGAEYSNIQQSGTNGLNRTFYRPKGFVSLGWRASPRLDISAKLEREVGQLNFYDFVASVNLSGGVGNVGNPRLRPPQSWNVELEASRNLGAFGSIKAKLFAEFINDAVVQRPIGAGEAPGNIDSARLFGLDWNSTFNFDPLGWKGAKLDIAAQFRNSRLSDPLTGEKRQLSEQLETEIDANFRHDIPGSTLAWGIDYNLYVQTEGYRLDQHSRFVNTPGTLGVFVEHKDVMGLTVRGGVSNLLRLNERFYRTIHNGRRTDPVLVYEDRSRYHGLVFNLSIRGSF